MRRTPPENYVKLHAANHVIVLCKRRYQSTIVEIVRFQTEHHLLSARHFGFHITPFTCIELYIMSHYNVMLDDCVSKSKNSCLLGWKADAFVSGGTGHGVYSLCSRIIIIVCTHAIKDYYYCMYSCYVFAGLWCLSFARAQPIYCL